MPALPAIALVDRRDTHRLIPAQFAEAALDRIAGDPTALAAISELDDATNDRLLAESGLLPGIDARELVFGIPSYLIINAAFTHPAPNGSRFNSPDRGAWYAAFELETSQAEVAYHKQLWLRETAWEEAETTDYRDYLADLHAEFHDLRQSKRHAACLSPASYSASQALAAQLLESGSAGIVYPSVRRSKGTCLACFRPVLVTNVRAGERFTFVFSGPDAAPVIRKSK
jgi:hypothetical protein